MISAQKALAIVLAENRDFGHREMPLADAIGEILAEDILADRDMPPFNRVAMDGIALDVEAINKGSESFPIAGIAQAGHPQATLEETSTCIEVMTGAPLPIGCNAVIRYEDLVKENDAYHFDVSVHRDQNIHQQGSDSRKGDILLKTNSHIKAIDINILASVGKQTLLVKKKPKIAVISSGDELVEVDTQPAHHQIRRSNVHMLQARLKELGFDSQARHLKDDQKHIAAEIESLLADNDILLLSGGVSKGKFDFIPSVMADLGCKKLFHRVAQRPGKPFWFGKINQKTIFAFPGNPTSTLACFHRYFVPWMNQCLGVQTKKWFGKLSHDYTFSKPLTLFATATLGSNDCGENLITIIRNNGSGDLVSPSNADGFAVLPQKTDTFKEGDILEFIPFAPLSY